MLTKKKKKSSWMMWASTTYCKNKHRLHTFQRDAALLKLQRYWGVVIETIKGFVAHNQQGRMKCVGNNTLCKKKREKMCI